jgi:4-hydroxybenzoate polyprenyltransferase
MANVMKAFLRLVRLPNVITAACNSLAGAMCVGVGFDRWPVLLTLAVVSMAHYAVGILLNDLFDLEEDRRERPERPLPSGAVSVRLVVVAAWLLSLGGLGLAWTVSDEVGLTAAALLASVIGYDIGLKRTLVGPWVMGLCRGLNLALGLALSQSPGIRELAPVVGYVFYIAGVTYISRQETYVGRSKGLGLGFAMIVVGLGWVLASILVRTGFRFDAAGMSDASPNMIIALFLLFVLLKMLARVWNRAAADPRPETIRPVVKAGVISLPLLDYAQTLAIAGALPSAVIAVLWVGARLAARKLYTT